MRFGVDKSGIREPCRANGVTYLLNSGGVWGESTWIVLCYWRSWHSLYW